MDLPSHDPTSQALAGIRVLDLAGTVAAAYCGKLFADYGADVLLVEPSEGFPTRRLAPFAADVKGPEAGGMHAYLSANKRSAVLSDISRLPDLAKDVTLVIDNGVGDDRPLSLSPLAEVSPQAVLTSITWFGQHGPYSRFAGSDGVCQALTGQMKVLGRPDEPPLIPSGYQAQITAGLTAFNASLAQVLARALGNAQGPAHLDVSIFESNLCFTEVGGVRGYNGNPPPKRLEVNRFPPTYPLGVYPCKDGWLGVTVLTPSQWKSFCKLLDFEHLADVEKYQETLGRLDDAEELEALITSRLKDRSADELFHKGQGMRIPLTIVPTMEQVFNVDQYASRGAFVEVSHPDLGAIQAPATPFRLFATPAKPGGQVSRLGADTEAVLSEHPASAGCLPRKPGAKHPADAGCSERGRRATYLKGLRIVDLSMGWAGPLCTRHLADLGAEVIKVESCTRFDWWRGWEATQDWIDRNGAETHEPFNTMNRNKFDVTLDLLTDRGRDLLLKLVAISDAVVENSTAGVLPKLNLSYEVFKQAKPNIVMASMKAFGSDGPWRTYRAYGSTMEQASGLPHLSGAPEWGPTMVHIALGDAVGGLNGLAGLLVALRHLKKTGEGQFLEMSQVECLFPMAAHGMVEQSLTGRSPERLGNRSRHFAPHGVYRCQGDDAWVVIQVQDEGQWEALRVLLGLNGFRDLDDRLSRNDELDGAINAWTQQRSAHQAMTALQQDGVPAAEVRSVAELTNDPQLKARAFWKLMDRAHVGEQPNPGAPYRLSSEPLEIEWPSPTLGQHNHEVLVDRLGLSEDELSELKREGIIGNRPRLPT